MRPCREFFEFALGAHSEKFAKRLRPGFEIVVNERMSRPGRYSKDDGPVAQPGHQNGGVIEHLAFNQVVAGSNIGRMAAERMSRPARYTQGVCK